MEMNYYDVLRLPRDTDPETIRKRYRQLARDLHPDVLPDKDTAHEQFIELVDAYQTLIDPLRRDAYDRSITGKIEDATPDITHTTPFSWREARRNGSTIATLIEAENILIHGDEGSLEQARMICVDVLKLEPNNHRAYDLLGDIFERQKKLNLAIKAYSYAVQFAPQIPLYQQRLNYLFQREEARGKGEPLTDNISKTTRRSLPLTFRIALLLAPLAMSGGALVACKTWPGKSLPIFNLTVVPGTALAMLPLCGFLFGLMWRWGNWIQSFDRALFWGDSFSVSQRGTPMGVLVGFASLGTVYSGFIAYIVAALLNDCLSLSAIAAFIISCTLGAAFAFAGVAKSFALLWGSTLAFWGFMAGWMTASFGREQWWE